MNTLDKEKNKKRNSILPTVAKGGANSYNTGKSRVQGGFGVGQGSQGRQAQINPIIKQISSGVSYNAPDITSSMLTNRGFNQGLNRIQSRNNAKLKLGNNRVLSRVLGTLVDEGTRNRNTNVNYAMAEMGNKTKRRGQDFDATARAGTLAETANRNKTLGKYYEGMNAIGNERNAISRQSMEYDTGGHKTLEQNINTRREQVIEDGFVQNLMTKEQYSEIDSDTKEAIKRRYITTGEVPTSMKRDDTAFLDNAAHALWEIVDEDFTPQYKGGGSQQTKISGKMFDAMAKDTGFNRADIKLSDDGERVILPNGNEAPIATVLLRYGDTNATGQ